MPELIPINQKKPPTDTASAEFKARSKALRSETDKRLDRLTALWRKIETRLIGLQHPRHVWYEYYTGTSGNPENPDDYDCCYIGIAKFAGKWRLCHGESNRRWSSEISWRPITDCSVEERLRAAKCVGKLEAKIIESGEQTLPKLDEAISHLEQHLAMQELAAQVNL
jgi:hypothetical protein